MSAQHPSPGRASRTGTRRALVLALFLGLATAMPAGAADGEAARESAATIVERLHASLLGVMKQAKTLGLAERFARLEPVVSEVYSMPRMLEVAVGGEWSKAAPEQREKLLDAFTDLNVATYAIRFDGFSGERFETVAERPGPRGTMLVETRIVRPEDAPVGLTYVAVEVDGAWRIVNVLLNNTISELGVRRSEYSRIIQREGIDGLIRTLRRKADELIPR